MWAEGQLQGAASGLRREAAHERCGSERAAASTALTRAVARVTGRAARGCERGRSPWQSQNGDEQCGAAKQRRNGGQE
eukprot:scaffold68252_cov103-Phaeocystis_antarctica.AAC.1